MGHDVFTNAFVNAMRPTLVIGAVVVLGAAVATGLARASSDQPAAQYPAAESRAMAAEG